MLDHHQRQQDVFQFLEDDSSVVNSRDVLMRSETSASLFINMSFNTASLTATKTVAESERREKTKMAERSEPN